MAGDVNFSGKLAKVVKLDDVDTNGVSSTNKEKIIQIFNSVTGGNNAKTLTTDELVVLSDVDANHNSKIEDSEIKSYFDSQVQDVGNGKFKIGTVEFETSQKEQIKTDYVAYLKAMAKANEDALKKSDNLGNEYTIQLGEDLDDLVSRIVEANGIPEDKKAAAKERYKAAIIANNKNNGAIKFDSNGNVKWLVAGQKLIIPTMTEDERSDKRVKDQNNKAAAESKYRAWRDGRGPLKSFKYAIDEDGKTYEVRGSERTEFDAQKEYDSATGKQVGSSGGSGGAGGSDEPISESDKLDMSRIVLTSKITEEDCVDLKDRSKHYDVADVKAKAEKGRDILANLNNPEKIKSCTPSDEKYKSKTPKYYWVEFEDGTRVKLHMDESGNISSIAAWASDKENLIKLHNNGDMYVDMDDANSVYDVKVAGAVKDFDKLKALVMKSNKVREAMELPSLEFVNYNKIVDEEMPDGVKADDVKDKVKIANGIIAKLENSSEIDSVKTEKKDGNKKEITIRLKDDTVVTAEMSAENKITKVTVQYKDSTEPDVVYDLKNGNITVNVNGTNVTTTGVVDETGRKDIEKFVKGAKTFDGMTVVEDSLGVIDRTNFESNKEYVANKASADGLIEKATNVINMLQDKDNIESVGEVEFDQSTDLYEVTIKMKDGTSVTLRCERDGSLYGVLVDLDGEGTSDVGIFASGINLAFDNESEDWDIKDLGKVDMNKMKRFIPKEVLDKFKLSDEQIVSMGKQSKVTRTEVDGRPAFKYGRNYFYKDNQSLLPESVDTDAIFVIDGHKYTLSKGYYTLDYYDITGQRTSWSEDDDTTLIDSKGHFKPDAGVFKHNYDVTLKGDGPLNGCKLLSENGNVCISYKGKKYGMDALMAGLYPEIK